MYKEIEYMYITCYAVWVEVHFDGHGKQALDLAISEHESNRLALEANERFLKSGVEIKDVYGRLDR